MSSEDELVQEFNDYVDSNDIQNLLKDAIVQLCIRKPVNPVKYLLDHFKRKLRENPETDFEDEDDYDSDGAVGATTYLCEIW